MKRILWLILVLCIASAFFAGAFSMPNTAPEPGADGRTLVQLGQQPQYINFVPAANGMYCVTFLPADISGFSVQAQLLQNGQPVAQGNGNIEARLVAGAQYTLELTGEGSVVAEFTRNSLSRSFEKALEIHDDDTYSKLIALSGDIHWYRFVSNTDGPAVIVALPEDEGLQPQCMLLNSTGLELSTAAANAHGIAANFVYLEKGVEYYVRVNAPAGHTGQYTLEIVRDEGSVAPEDIQLSPQSIQLEKGETLALWAEVFPDNAFADIYFNSSDETVAGVTRTGIVTARSSGTAVITATGYGGIQAHCTVTVNRVPTEGISFDSPQITLRAEEQALLMFTFYPSDATDRRVRFSIADPSVAQIDEAGIVTGLRQGSTTVTVTTLDGAFSDTVAVNVQPAAPGLYALLVGQHTYDAAVNTERTGSINSVNGIKSMLGELSLNGGRFETTVLFDTDTQGLFSAIETAFARAEQGDTCLFYITCHGFYRYGMSFLQMPDGSLVSARDLEQALRKLPCHVTVIVDCCGSGGILGASDAEDFSNGMVSSFSGTVGGPVFASTKYTVLASAAPGQDSYRVSFSGSATEERMATVFARSLCDALGWNIDKSQRSAMRADTNFDRSITLNELWLYVSRRVQWYLQLASNGDAGYAQNVQVFPENSAQILFGR